MSQVTNVFPVPAPVTAGKRTYYRRYPMLTLAAAATALPAALQLATTLSTIVSNMIAAGRTNSTAEEDAALAAAQANLATANAAFNAEFADVLPKT